jgi:hypothetical protein
VEHSSNNSDAHIASKAVAAAVPEKKTQEVIYSMTVELLMQTSILK